MLTLWQSRTRANFVLSQLGLLLLLAVVSHWNFIMLASQSCQMPINMWFVVKEVLEMQRWTVILFPTSPFLSKYWKIPYISSNDISSVKYHWCTFLKWFPSSVTSAKAVPGWSALYLLHRTKCWVTNCGSPPPLTFSGFLVPTWMWWLCWLVCVCTKFNHPIVSSLATVWSCPCMSFLSVSRVCPSEFS